MISNKQDSMHNFFLITALKFIGMLFFLFLSACTNSETNQMSSAEEDKAYEIFFKRVQDEEPYIGFLAAENACIRQQTDAYLAARREFFLGVSRCKEDPEEFIEPFFEFCQAKGFLKDGCEEKWENTLTILSYELYPNTPIFEFSAENIIEHRNLVFAEYPNKKLALDLFLPKEPLDQPVPVVVCIHGGGWRVNRRVWFEPFAAYLASRGIAAVTIDYRMLPAVEVIDCVYDTKAAVRWVRANAASYGLDPQRIGAIGASAGGHLVALLATTADLEDLEGSGGNPDVSSAIQAAVGIATPAFNVASDDQIADWLGLSVEEIKRISPYEHVSPESAPLYLIHGTTDDVVNPQDSQDLYDKYKAAGVPVKLKWIEGEDHGFYEGTDIAIALATAYFKEQFGRD